MSTSTSVISQKRASNSNGGDAAIQLRYPKLLALCLALIPVLSGTKRGLIVPGLRLSEALAVAALLVLLVSLNRTFRVGGAVFWGLLSYAAVTSTVVAFHWFNSSDLGTKDFISYGLGPIVLLLTFVAAYGAGAVVRPLLLDVCRYSIVLAALMGVVGFLQIAGVASARRFASTLTGNQSIVNMPDWKVLRGIGIFHSWHAYASYMAFVLIVAVALLAYGVKLFERKTILAVCMTCVGIGLISSLTFGMTILGLGGAAYFLIRRGKWIIALFGAVIVLVVSQTSFVSEILSDRFDRQAQVTNEYGFLPQTVAFRLSIWTREFIPLISDNPLIGNGPLRASDRVFEHAESMYILVLVTTGVVGVVAIVGFLLATASSLSRRLRATRGCDIGVAAATEAVLVFLAGLVILMFIHPYLNDAGGSELLVILVGIIMGSSHLGGGPDTTTVQSRSARLDSRALEGRSWS